MECFGSASVSVSLSDCSTRPDRCEGRMCHFHHRIPTDMFRCVSN